MKKIVAMLLIVMLLFAASACTERPPAEEPAEEPPAEEEVAERVIQKAALLLMGNISDRGWNQTAYEALTNLEDKFGIEISYHENTPASDFEELFIMYADSGYDLIIGHGFAFGDAAERVADMYPESNFVVTSRQISNGRNLGGIICSSVEASFLQGVVAGLATQTNHLGTIALHIPAVLDSAIAYEAGAKYINPDVTVVLSMLDDRHDAAGLKEMALAHFEAGADIVMANAAPAEGALLDAARETGKLAATSIYDGTDSDVVFSSNVLLYQLGIEILVEKMEAGTWGGQFYGFGVSDGASDVAVNAALAEGLLTAEDWEIIEQVKDDVANRRIDIVGFITEELGVGVTEDWRI